MEFLKTISAACALFLMTAGLFALVAAWISPRFLERPLLRWMITGKRLAPTQGNQRLMACWAILLGCHLLLLWLGHPALGLMVLVLWLPFGIVVFKRTHSPATGA